MGEPDTSEFWMARACFVLSMALFSGMLLYWALKTESHFRTRLIACCLSGAAVLFVLPESLRWVNNRDRAFLNKKGSSPSQQRYSGETMLKMFVPGLGQRPEAIGQSNIFRWIPVNMNQVDTTTGKITKSTMFLFLVFQQDVDDTAFTFTVKTSVNPEPEWKFQDHGPRSCLVTIEDMPTGTLEVVLQKPPIATQPSPTPNKRASPP